MIEYKTITTPNRAIITIPIQDIQPTKTDLLNDLKQTYLALIRDAQDLGETEEVTRLQNEYQTRKAQIESAT